MFYVNKLSLKKVVAILAFIFAVAMFFPCKSSFAIDRNNWMKEIMDDTKISWMTIPGTHDSTTFNVKCSTWGSLVESGATCQSLNIENQLASGIRAFDLRYKWENNDFYLYHGQDSYECKCLDLNGNHLTLSTVFQKFRTFLDAHPGEFIIANVQKETGDYNSEELTKVLNTYNVTSVSFSSTTVGSVRGKIVNGSSFMQNIPGSSEYNRWEGTVDQKVADLKSVFSKAPSIQKYYSSTIAQLCICTNLSWRKSSLTTWPKDYAEDVQKGFFSSNPFESYGQKAYGVILYDFPTTTILDWTISANDWAEPITCTIKFNTGKGSAVSNKTITEGNLVTKPDDPLLASYTFSGWYKDADYKTEWNFLTDKAKDATTTLYAKWTPVNYSIKYEGVDGASNQNASKTVYNIESETYTLKDAVKSGWTFKGWYNSAGKQVTKITKGETGDITLTARWEIKNYKITYNNLDGAINPNTITNYTVTSDSIELKDPTKEHYLFGGWYNTNNKKVTEIPKGSTGDCVLTAKWTPEEYSITYDNVTAKENPNKITSYNVETSTITLANPKRSGYVFLGWYDQTGKKVGKIQKGSFGNLTLSAKWSTNVHTVTYKGVDGATNPNIVTEFSVESDTFELKDASKKGYVFDGWYDEKGFLVTQIEKGTDNDVILIAKWTPVEYTINYSNVDNATNPNTVNTFTVETATITLKDCKKNGYRFDGWYEKDGTSTGKWGNRVTEIKKGTTSNVILYAKWTQTVSMKRLYNPYTGEHFYTSDEREFDNLVALSWKDEGIGWTAPATSKTPVYRLYNPNSGDHHYTTSASERDTLKKAGWNYEGIGWYSDDDKGQALYRQYNPNALTGTHNYTTSKAENDKLVKLGWRAEGISWYGIK
jgi:uncharacterized repeat protein (TIGR02543 family)